MVDLKTIITLAFITCIVHLGAYELYPKDEKVSNEFIIKC